MHSLSTALVLLHHICLYDWWRKHEVGERRHHLFAFIACADGFEIKTQILGFFYLIQVAYFVEKTIPVNYWSLFPDYIFPLLFLLSRFSKGLVCNSDNSCSSVNLYQKHMKSVGKAICLVFVNKWASRYTACCGITCWGSHVSSSGTQSPARWLVTLALGILQCSCRQSFSAKWGRQEAVKHKQFTA